MHGLLLTLPFNQPGESLRKAMDSARLPILVNLKQAPLIRRPDDADPVPESREQPDPQTAADPDSEQAAIASSQPGLLRPQPGAPVADDEVPPEELPSAAFLLHSRDDGSWTISVPEDKGRNLGEPALYTMPSNWRKGAGAKYFNPEENLFDGMVAPAKVEIVDRWLAADGSQNVVIKTPSGHTLCGRAEWSDPMRPLVEKVMMFRPCGGGGKRTFTMPHRRDYNRDFIDQVVKSASDQ
jgi:hypothetical protein